MTTATTASNPTTPSTTSSGTRRGWLRHPALAIALLALLLRLVFVLVLDPTPDFSGGDANWYMQNGRHLVRTGTTAGPLQSAPFYLVALGTVQVLVPGQPDADREYNTAEMQVVRVIQSVLGTAVVLCVYALGSLLLTRRTGLLASAVLALSPALIIEAGNLTTESSFLFWMFGGLALYTWAWQHDAPPGRGEWLRWLLAGAVFGLATLTRAVFLLFPLGLALHLLLTRHRAGLRRAALLLVAYGAMVSTWTVYNLVEWDRVIIGGEGILSFLYQGASGEGSPHEIDQELSITLDDEQDDRDRKLRSAIADDIGSDPVGWARHRLTQLGREYLQPHNTYHYDGPAIRYLFEDWLRTDRTPAGLADLTGTEAFWPKLAIYLFHFGGLALGAAGMLIQRHRWRALLPLYGVILYFSGIHLLLLALARYLFPMHPVFWLFAAAFIVQMWERRRASPGI